MKQTMFVTTYLEYMINWTDVIEFHFALTGTELLGGEWLRLLIMLKVQKSEKHNQRYNYTENISLKLHQKCFSKFRVVLYEFGALNPKLALVLPYHGQFWGNSIKIGFLKIKM